MGWPAISAATALLTSMRARADDPQAEIIAGQPPEQVVTALAIVSTVLLEALAPDAAGDRFLEHLGLAALEHGSGRPE